MASKVKFHILESVRNCNSPLLLELVAWLGCSAQGRKHINYKSFPSPPLHLRLYAVEFTSWWKINEIVSIFFDGASKGNPCIAGGGGLIFFPNCVRETCFS